VRLVKTIVQLSSSTIPGGAEMVVSRLASSLDPRRFRPIVCLFSSGWLEDRCVSQGIDTRILPILGMVDWKWGKEFFRFLKTEHIDLVHAHEFTANTYGVLLARLAGIPVIATVHGKSYYVDQLKRRLAYRVASRMATMVTVSEDLKQFVASRLNISSTRLRVIYNGVPELELVAPSETEKLKHEMDIPANHKVVGVIGSFYPVKGHTYLLQAIPDIVARVGNVTFLLAGRGELESSLKREATELGVDQYVRFLGFRNDVPRLLALMDLFVLPSLSEGLSIAILEAMSTGRSVVAKGEF
jgi:glycosyltransferase involved in cell wall biosynthesis